MFIACGQRAGGATLVVGWQSHCQTKVPCMIDLPLYSFSKLREEGELAVFRGMRPDDGAPVLLIAAASEHPSPSSINRIKHAYSLRDELDSAWAIRPLELLNTTVFRRSYSTIRAGISWMECSGAHHL